MQLYVIRRRNAWATAADLEAAAARSTAAGDKSDSGVRWIRSYVVSEEDGTFSAYCIYEATGPEVLRRHADALGLPTDAIKPVAATIVAAPDPEPAGTA